MFLLLIITLGLLIAGLLWVWRSLPVRQGTPVRLQRQFFEAPSTPVLVDDRHRYRTATELATMIRNGEVTSTAIARACIARITNENHRYNALVHLRAEEALADAARADAAIANGDTNLGALHGVPITIKEQFWVQGAPSTLNAKQFGFTAPADAALVQSLKRAGAIILGTTNVPYMLSDYQTHGEVYPPASNPYAATHTPGGSSGGGAAAVAAGFSAGELGSDMGGSIRVPAAFCGLWALKPTYGALNQTQGGWPDTTRVQRRLAMASPGPLARAPEDLQLLWDALKHTPIDPRYQRPIERRPATGRALHAYRFAWADAWPDAAYTMHVGQAVRAAVDALTGALRAHGATVQQAVPPIHADLMHCFFGTFALVHGEDKPWLLRQLMTRHMRALDPGTGTFASYAAAMRDPSDAHWERIQAERDRLTAVWESFFQEHDFLVLPVTYGPAFPKCAQGATLTGDHGPLRYVDYFPFCAVINATGHPTLSVPMGLDAQGLPIGLQVVGPLYSEEELLHLAGLLKAVVPRFVEPPPHKM